MHLCCHLFFMQWWEMLSLTLPECALSELLYADDLVLIRETIKVLVNKLRRLLRARVRKLTLGKTKVMVSGGFTKDGMSKSKVDPCGVCGLRAKANSA